MKLQMDINLRCNHCTLQKTENKLALNICCINAECGIFSSWSFFLFVFLPLATVTASIEFSPAEESRWRWRCSGGGATGRSRCLFPSGVRRETDWQQVPRLDFVLVLLKMYTIIFTAHLSLFARCLFSFTISFNLNISKSLMAISYVSHVLNVHWSSWSEIFALGTWL